MIRANYIDKQLVVDILSESFDTNKSVNYIVKQDEFRRKRIKRLMEYTFETCFMFGEIYLSDDQKGCILILDSEKRKINFRSLILDFQLAATSIGLTNIFKVLKRETKIKSQHPKNPYFHLWFIGVKTNSQKQGIGSNLLMEMLKENKFKTREIYLETSTISNIPWYQKFGFNVIQELNLGYTLKILKKEKY